MQLRGGQLERGFVIGGYRIDELISRGGMGVVYRATNVALNRIYALKVLAPELADDEQFRERFKREMRIAASITIRTWSRSITRASRTGCCSSSWTSSSAPTCASVLKQSGRARPRPGGRPAGADAPRRSMPRTRAGSSTAT